MKIIKLDVREDSELEGIDAVALVESPAIEVDFQAFAKHQFQSFDDYNHGTTSSITYKVQVANTNGSTGTHDSNQPGYGQGGRMTIMEVQV